MSDFISAAEMRGLEKAAIVSGTVTGLQLMERAGQGVLDALWGAQPQLAQGPQTAIVLCGPGNNGGDGFVVARLLLELGWKVTVFFYGDIATLLGDARTNYDR